MNLKKASVVCALFAVASGSPHRDRRQEQPGELPIQEIQDMQYYHRMTGTTTNTNYSGKAANSFQILLEHDCDGDLHFLPDMPQMTWTMTADARISTIFRQIRDSIRSDATCRCPDLGHTLYETDFDDNFGLSADAVLKVLQGRSSKANLDSICTGSHHIDNSITSLGGDAGDEPVWHNAPGSEHYVATCTSENFLSQGCTASYHGMGEAIQVGLKQCPTSETDSSPDFSKLPYFVISCEGPQCSNNFKPCTSNPDCREGHPYATNMTCDNLGELFEEGSTADVGEALVDLMEGLGLFSPSYGGTDTCSATKAEMEPRLFANIMGTLGFMTGQNPATAATKTKMCGLSLLRKTFEDLESPSFDNVANWTGVLPNGVHVFDFVTRPHLNRNVDPGQHVTQACQDSYNAGNVVPVIQHQCRGLHGGSGAFFLGPLSPFRLGIQPMQMQRIFHSLLATTFQQVALDCGMSPSHNFMASQFWLWNPGFWIKFATAGNDLLTYATDGVGEYSSNVAGQPATEEGLFADGMMGDAGYGGKRAGGPKSLTPYKLLKMLLGFDGVLRLPSTCSQSTWDNNGVCQLQYTNLTHLFGFPEGSLTLRFTMSKCADPDFTLPYIYMDCVGSHCKQIFEFYLLEPCATNADCVDAGRGSTCQSYDDVELSEDGDGIFSELLWGGSRGDNGDGDTCGSRDQDMHLLMNTMRVLQNRPILSEADFSAKPMWCQTIIEANLADRAEEWSEHLFIDHTDGSEDAPMDGSIRGLQAWSAAAAGSDGCDRGIRDGDHAWVGGDRPPNHGTYGSDVTITYTGGTTSDLTSAELMAFQFAVREQFVDQSEGSIEMSDIDYIEVANSADGSGLIAIVHLKTGRVPTDALATVTSNIQAAADAGETIEIGGTTFTISAVSSSTESQGGDGDGGGGDGGGDDTWVIVGAVIGVVLAVAIGAGVAVYYMREKNAGRKSVAISVDSSAPAVNAPARLTA